MARPFKNPKKPLNFECRFMINKSDHVKYSVLAEYLGVTFSEMVRILLEHYNQNRLKLDSDIREIIKNRN